HNPNGPRFVRAVGVTRAMLLVHCPHCRQPMMVPEASAGQPVRCPHCNGVARTSPPAPVSPAAGVTSKLATPSAAAPPPPRSDGPIPVSSDELDYARM